MSFGYVPFVIHTMEEETIREIVPNEFQAFLDALNEASNDLEDEELDGDAFILESNLDETIQDDLSDDHPVKVAYIAFQHAFTKATGLSICHIFHDSEDGSAYDEINGYAWSIGNVNTFTPQAIAVLDKYGKSAITEQSFVVGC